MWRSSLFRLGGILDLKWLQYFSAELNSWQLFSLGWIFAWIKPPKEMSDHSKWSRNLWNWKEFALFHLSYAMVSCIGQNLIKLTHNDHLMGFYPNGDRGHICCFTDVFSVFIKIVTLRALVRFQLILQAMFTKSFFTITVLFFLT